MVLSNPDVKTLASGSELEGRPRMSAAFWDILCEEFDIDDVGLGLVDQYGVSRRFWRGEIGEEEKETEEKGCRDEVRDEVTKIYARIYAYSEARIAFEELGNIL